MSEGMCEEVVIHEYTVKQQHRYINFVRVAISVLIINKLCVSNMLKKTNAFEI